MSELERLRNDVDIELKETGRWVTTFTRIQCWGRDKNRARLPSTSPASTSLQESVGTLVPATMIAGYARRRVGLRAGVLTAGWPQGVPLAYGAVGPSVDVLALSG